MKQLKKRLLIISIVLLPTVLFAQSNLITIDLQSGISNPKQLTMGDKIFFESTIKNNSGKPINGLVGWINLVELTVGHEQPMDLEDWSAHKAISQTTLEPGGIIKTNWPMRLIKSGDYRVIIAVTSRAGNAVSTSHAIDFHVSQRPVISSNRVLFIALVIPLILLILLIYRRKLYGNRESA